MILIRLVLICLLFACCQKAPSTTTFSGVEMTIPYRIVIGAALTPDQMSLVQKIIQTTFAEVDNTFNQWNPNSEISRFNRHPVHEPFVLTPGMADFLYRCSELVKLTDGRFDPTIEPVWKLWRPHLQNGQLPTDEEIAQASSRAGWQHLRLDGSQAAKDVPGLALNLDSVAKGHCIDLITTRLVDAEFPNLLVEWGGEMRASGEHPTGRPWKIAIRAIDSRDEPFANLDLINLAVATSGDYLQYWHVGEATYTHIIDPTTFRPLQIEPGTVASVSVLASECMLADALATAAMAWGRADAAELWTKRLQAQLPEVQLWIVLRKQPCPFGLSSTLQDQD